MQTSLFAIAPAGQHGKSARIRPGGGWRRLAQCGLLALSASVPASAVAGRAGPVADRPLPAITAGAPDLDVIAFGTSLTARYDWPERLGTGLGSCLGRHVVMSKVAAPGQGSSWALQAGLLEMEKAVVRTGRPDLVIVEFAVNDADLLDGVRLARSRRQHVQLLEGIRPLLAPGGQILLMTTNPVEGLMRRLQRPRLASYNQLYVEISAEADTGLADLMPRWRQAMADSASSLLRDGLHPRPEAARAVILPVLMPMIAAALGHSAGC